MSEVEILDDPEVRGGMHETPRNLPFIGIRWFYLCLEIDASETLRFDLCGPHGVLVELMNPRATHDDISMRSHPRFERTDTPMTGLVSAGVSYTDDAVVSM